MEKIVNRLICDAVEGVDKYISNGSIWLIFTDDKKWVIELTKDGTLWYNYNFFKGLFAYTSMDVVENQHYITKWVEDTIINGVKNTTGNTQLPIFYVEDAIENGVKHTSGGRNYGPYRVEDTIQNGVKDTKNLRVQEITMVQPTIQKIRDIEDTIQNGVKETHSGCDLLINDSIEDVIQNGVKEIHWVEYSNLRSVEDTIQNGVKYTIDTTHHKNKYVEDAIKNGVKYTGGIGNPNWMGNKVENAIENGVKTTYSDVIPQEYDWSDQFDVNDVIENGIKATVYNIGLDENQESEVSDVIQNGIKETHDDVYHHKGRVDGVIRNGVKVVIPAFKMIYNPMNFEPVISEEKRITDVTDVIRDGIKEVQPLPAQDGNRDWGVYYYRKGEPTKPHTKYVDEVIENGIKEN